MNQADSLSLALSYAARGWLIFPIHSISEGCCTCGKKDCDRPAKHPLTQHGLKDASVDQEQIRRWHEQTKGLCNWAIATGPASGLWSLDDDNQGEAITGLELHHGPLPLSPRFRTGGGGEQRLFCWPADGTEVKSRVRFRASLDTRGQGGYIIVPPSLHASGKRYEWLTPTETPLAAAPDWLLRLVSGERRQAQDKGPAPLGSGLVITVGPPTEDLLTHPGTGQGNRNATLARLAGVHLARGDSLGTVEALALAWAEKCDPPYPEREVYRTIHQLAAKHQRQRQGEADETDTDEVRTNEGSTENPTPEPFLRSFVAADASPLDPATSAPVVDGIPELHADAYHGMAGAIVQAVAPETEADPAAILLQLLTAVGNAVGPGPHFRVGPGRHAANLFTLIVGDTASAKGQSLEIVLSLMKQVDPEWFQRCLCHGLSSGQGLIESVKDAQLDGEAEDGLKVNVNVTAEGSIDKRLLAVETEFAGPVKLMRREGNNLSQLLRNAWDGKPLEVRNRKRNALRATGHHIGVIGHITPEELEHELGGRPELANGFSNRFLFCCCWRQKLLPFGGNPAVLQPFVKPLTDALAVAKSIGECQRSEMADQLWVEVYPSLAESKSGAYGKAVERARPQTMRLAMLFALLDGKAIIEADHLKAGLAVWAYADASARRIFVTEASVNNREEDTEEPLAVRLLGVIQATPGVNRTGLHEALGRNRKAEEIAAALAWLQTQGLVHSETIPTGGRSGECWFPGPAASSLVGEVSSDSPMPTAETNERSKPDKPIPEPNEGTNEERSAPRADQSSPYLSGQEILRSFVPVSLVELVQAVNTLPGRFVWRNGSVVVDAEVVPDHLADACRQLQADLAALVPQPQAIEPASPPAADVESPLTEEEFLQELLEMDP